MTATTEAPATTAAGTPSLPAPAISLAGVTKNFQSGRESFTAVGGLDLDIQAGEFFSLLGPSGCGKTTTMRMIAGFEEPTTGVVRLDGTDVTGVAPNHRDVNMVFQSYALFPHLSVADNVAFGLKRKRVGKAETDRRVAEMLSLVELGDHGSRKPSQLSGGQRQRVALARALVNQPRALLLDEPLAALDLKLRQAMQMELKRIQRDIGITFIYVTHDQGEALTMSDRIAVMNGGYVEQLGTPAEIYERPATRFVAEFIGTSNLLTGTAAATTADGTDVRLDCGQRVRIAERLSEGTPVDITVRPEKIQLSTAPPDDSLSRVRGTVSDTVYLGSSTHYTVRLDTDTEIVVFQQNDRDLSAADAIAGRGSEVWLSWRPTHSYLLPS
ncbi:ABC transporter ATP-binding protein [Haloechinothrix halophila]|uniref:ABC transporter ATP-binding protein n=1 Tax=Haloechinothrix halophila TaxID=1069073 RepID=UPI000558F47F|nr:ABC transporter ATP-binding protein [Haloechinothrix halophila]